MANRITKSAATVLVTIDPHTIVRRGSSTRDATDLSSGELLLTRLHGANGEDRPAARTRCAPDAAHGVASPVACGIPGSGQISGRRRSGTRGAVPPPRCAPSTSPLARSQVSPALETDCDPASGPAIRPSEGRERFQPCSASLLRTERSPAGRTGESGAASVVGSLGDLQHQAPDRGGLDPISDRTRIEDLRAVPGIRADVVVDEARRWGATAQRDRAGADVTLPRTAMRAARAGGAIRYGAAPLVRAIALSARA